MTVLQKKEANPRRRLGPAKNRTISSLFWDFVLSRTLACMTPGGIVNIGRIFALAGAASAVLLIVGLSLVANMFEANVSLYASSYGAMPNGANYAQVPTGPSQTSSATGGPCGLLPVPGVSVVSFSNGSDAYVAGSGGSQSLVLSLTNQGPGSVTVTQVLFNQAPISLSGSMMGGSLGTVAPFTLGTSLSGTISVRASGAGALISPQSGITYPITLVTAAGNSYPSTITWP